MISWVIGSGGLLGRALCGEIARNGGEVFTPNLPIGWDDPSAIPEQLRHLVRAFAEAAKGADRWRIFWSAGVGNMASEDAELIIERNVFERLLNEIGSATSLRLDRGIVALASSAGALHVSDTQTVIHETTPPASSTPYARSKLLQEERLACFCREKKGVSGLSARISTLYGPTPRPGRRKGLIAHMAHCVVRNKPIGIYVPLDTMRDYLSAQDAARMMLMATSAEGCDERYRIRLVASERSTSVAEIVSEFKKVAHRPVRVMMGTTGFRPRYPPSVAFKSLFRGAEYPIITSPLRIGIADMLAAERIDFVRA
jgi:UDP-glucose 4-epimerase